MDCPKCSVQLEDSALAARFEGNIAIDLTVKCEACGHAVYTFVSVSDLVPDPGDTEAGKNEA